MSDRPCLCCELKRFFIDFYKTHGLLPERAINAPEGEVLDLSEIVEQTTHVLASLIAATQAGYPQKVALIEAIGRSAKARYIAMELEDLGKPSSGLRSMPAASNARN